MNIDNYIDNRINNMIVSRIVLYREDIRKLLKDRHTMLDPELFPTLIKGALNDLRVWYALASKINRTDLIEQDRDSIVRKFLTIENNYSEKELKLNLNTKSK